MTPRLSAEIALERAEFRTDLAVATGDEERIAAARAAEAHARAYLLQLATQEAETEGRAKLRRIGGN